MEIYFCCGEGGKCGREEIDVIAPAIEKAREMGIDANGPFPSDILFIKAFNGDFDGVVTMYHDQGQIALKLKGLTRASPLPEDFRRQSSHAPMARLTILPERELSRLRHLRMRSRWLPRWLPI